MPTSPLKNVSVVLVDTKTPANIGAVARCMMNMDICRLVLVRPPADPGADARKVAAGADDILDTAVSYPSLKEAVADQGLVIGASRHTGRIRKNIRTPRETAQYVLPLLDRNAVSIVFGNEVNGLDKADLALCQDFILIPSSGAFPSLNLSHAFMVVAYELFVASRGPFVPVSRELASDQDLEHFYEDLQTTLVHAGFLDRNHPERMMFSLRQMFGRARLDARDVKILRGIIRSLRGTDRS
jgi:TrmH family RNA methyltransferase